MVDDGHQIGVERRGLGRSRRRSLQHPEHVGGVAQGGVRRDGGEALAGADGRRREHRRRGQEAQGDIDIVAIRQPGHQGAHHVQRRPARKVLVQGGDLGEGPGPRLAQAGAHAPGFGQALDHAVQQQVAGALVGDASGQVVQGEAADDQPACLAVDVRQHRLGRHHITQSIHVRTPGF